MCILRTAKGRFIKHVHKIEEKDHFHEEFCLSPTEFYLRPREYPKYIKELEKLRIESDSLIIPWGISKDEEFKIEATVSHLYNCHGFTFCLGQLWVGFSESINEEIAIKEIDEQIRTILDDDEYYFVDGKDALVGDIVVYCHGPVNLKANKKYIVHTGLIADVREGMIIRVRSKWGHYGIYNHAPDCVLDNMGHIEEIRRTNLPSSKKTGPRPN